MQRVARQWKMGSAAALAVGGALLLAGLGAQAQGCTTQAKMTPDVRGALANASLALATAVKSGDVVKVESMTIAEFAATPTTFAPTASLVRTTSAKVAQDSLELTQLYVLDARNRPVGDGGDAEFSCPLTGSPAETDFAIASLPAGIYGFSMVEAAGPGTAGARPWLLAFLLRQDAGVWKLAGFYPRARTAAGHDGAWYWKTAYDDLQAKQMWPAWLLFREADELLRPANFVTSTKLDSLRSEQRNALPAELANGLTSDTPLVMKAADGTEIRLTSIEPEASDDGERLNLVLHMKADWLSDAAEAKARNQAAAKTFLAAHAELRPLFSSLIVFADSPGHDPVLTELTMNEIQ